MTMILDALARSYSMLIRNWLTADQLRDVIALTKTKEYRTNDWSAASTMVDHNMAMLEAWQAMFGEDPRFLSLATLDAKAERELKLWNAAERLAEANEFWAALPPAKSCLTFDEFRATRMLVSVAEAARVTGNDVDFFGRAVGVWIYDETMAISRTHDDYGHLLIEREEWTGPRHELERILYTEHYLWHECTDLHEQARNFMEAYSRKGWQTMSFDEWLAEHGELLPPAVKRGGHQLLAKFPEYGG